jgi:hypothetical protein
MRPETVREKVEEIRKAAHDPEAAHSLEDALYAEILAAIASGGCTRPEECAAEALKTQEIEFERWTA